VVQVAALGDSITAGVDERSQYEYWAEEAQPTLEFENCGVFGERTDEIASRLEACAADADVLVVQGGINDIAQGVSVESVAENLREMVVRGQDLGLEVYLVDVLPWNNGHPQADRSIAELNRMIRAIGREEGVEILGFHDELEQPAGSGLMGAELTVDGDHPSEAGARLLGVLVAREFSDGR
jgi:lysophospholipase L1-like esterase